MEKEELPQGVQEEIQIQDSRCGLAHDVPMRPPQKRKLNGAQLASLGIPQM